MPVDWQTTLTPLLVILVPAILSQGKKLLGGNTWLVPLIAPALGAALDYVSSLVTQTQVGSTKAAMLGLAGVGLREALDQMRQRATKPMIPPPVRSIVLALALPTLLLAATVTPT